MIACWHQTTGEGPHLVIVHGTMDRATSFARLARALPGHTITRYDRRGYGRSLDLGVPESIEQQVDDLHTVIDGRPSIVFGHSYGGTIAMAAAANGPGSILGVVAYESPMPWTAWWPASSAGAAAVASAHDPEAAGEAFMRRMIGDDRWERLPRSTKTARRAEGATLAAEIGQLRPPHGPAFDPADLGVPVVAAHGTEGASHHARSMREVSVAAPHAELVVVDGAGHGIHLSHPAAAADLVARLEARLGG